MNSVQLYRKRFIPNEVLPLHDVIVTQNEDILITTWQTIRPKLQLDHGCSCYYLREGFKISKFYAKDHTLLYWYCDIMEFVYEKQNSSLITTDLLADVIVYPDGRVEVVDLDELAEAHANGLITDEQLHRALQQLSHLLSIIYQGNFCRLQEPLQQRGL